MTRSELKRYAQLLEARQAELAKLIRNRDGIVIEKSPDAFDELQYAAEREMAIRNLDRDSNLLRNVRAAHRRIEEGSFGLCLHCEDDISSKRLNAVPWAAFCIRCQELVDQGDKDHDDVSSSLVNAA